MKSDIHSASPCSVGTEQYEAFVSTVTGRALLQYDYRVPGGRLFSTIAPDLATARARLDAWLQANPMGGDHED